MARIETKHKRFLELRERKLMEQQARKAEAKQLAAAKEKERLQKQVRRGAAGCVIISWF